MTEEERGKTKLPEEAARSQLQVAQPPTSNLPSTAPPRIVFTPCWPPGHLCLGRPFWDSSRHCNPGHFRKPSVFPPEPTGTARGLSQLLWGPCFPDRLSPLLHEGVHPGAGDDTRLIGSCVCLPRPTRSTDLHSCAPEPIQRGPRGFFFMVKIKHHGHNK